MATSKELKQAEKDGAAAKPETAAELQEKIRAQVEYYMSRQNLLQDQFLIGKMDKDHYVDISVIAEFKLIKQLTSDVDLILASVKGSDQIVIDEVKKRIKPATLNQRTTLILRNIPTTAEKEEVEALLATVSVPKILSLRPDVGDNWFATFESEDATKNALELVKGLKWQDKRISAAIKSENVLKSLAVGGGSFGVVGQSQLFVPMNVSGNGGYMVPNGQYNYSYGSTAEGGQGGYRQGGGRGAVGGRRGPGVAPGAGAVNGNGAAVAGDGLDNSRRPASGKKKGRALREGGGREAPAETVRSGSSLPNALKEVLQASINLADFPILEAKNAKKKDGDTVSKVDTRAKNPEAAGETQKRDNPGPSAATDNAGAPAAEAASSCNGNSDAPSVPAVAGPPKKSYAQMALASANASSGGSSTTPAPAPAPAVAPPPAVQNVAAKATE